MACLEPVQQQLIPHLADYLGHRTPAAGYLAAVAERLPVVAVEVVHTFQHTLTNYCITLCDHILVFGAANTASNGTTVKFNPPTGQDTMMKNGSQQQITTKHQCISAMKEYETKSLEELRVEDYLANRKGPQAGSTTGSTLFGGTNTSAANNASTGFSFGGSQSNANKPAFGNMFLVICPVDVNLC